MSELNMLRHARERYAAAPSHAPYRTSPEPCTYCVITACFSHPPLYQRVAGAAGIKVRAIGEMGGDNEPLIRWNAENTTETVLAAFDRAIEEMAA